MKHEDMIESAKFALHDAIKAVFLPGTGPETCNVRNVMQYIKERTPAIHRWLTRYINDRDHGWRLVYDLRGDWSGGMLDERQFLTFVLGITDDDWFDSMTKDMASMTPDEREQMVEFMGEWADSARAQVESLQAYLAGDESAAPKLRPDRRH